MFHRLWPSTLLFLAAMGISAGAPAGVEFTAPLEVTSYPLLFVKLSVDGKETLGLVDTGAFHGFELSAAFAAKIGLASEADANTTAARHEGAPVKLRRGVVRELALGDYRARDVAVEIGEADIDRIAQQVGTPFEVLIGWGFFSKFHVLLDYPAKKLVWRTEPFADVGGGLVFAYTDRSRVPIVEGTIDGREVRLLVDSGAPICNLDPEFAAAKAGERVTRTLALGGSEQRVEFRVKEMAALKRGSGAAAVLGNNVLKSQRVYFNPAEHTVRLVPAPAAR